MKEEKVILELSWVEIFFRLLPETFIYIWGIHVISRTPFNIRKSIFLCAILSIFIFFVRMLPIYLGVHMIINIILTISIMSIAGISIIKSIYSTLIVYFMLSLGEFLNMIVLNLLNIDTSSDFLNPFMKCLLGVPSLIILVVFVVIFNYVSKRREEINNVYN